MPVQSAPHNPELATEQILNLAPIVKGQKEPQAFEIPPLSSPQPTASLDGKKGTE